ncbi:MAG: hypothetical protein U0936_09675, partial [Planctomycetaceae bacterium]
FILPTVVTNTSNRDKPCFTDFAHHGFETREMKRTSRNEPSLHHRLRKVGCRQSSGGVISCVGLLVRFRKNSVPNFVPLSFDKHT